MLGNGALQERLEAMIASLGAALPNGWKAELIKAEWKPGDDLRLDAALRVTSAARDSIDFAVEAKPTIHDGSSLTGLLATRKVAESRGLAGLIVLPVAAILVGTPHSAVSAIRVRANVAFTGLRAVRAYLPQKVAHLAPETQVMCYTFGIADVAGAAGWQPMVAPAANVILIDPQDSAWLGEPAIVRGIPVAPLPLVLANLLTLPGRYPQQAEALMDALAKADPGWKP